MTNADELDALPVDSYCKCACGYHVLKRSWYGYVFNSGRVLTRGEMLSEHLPLTVLYRPDKLEARPWSSSSGSWISASGMSFCPTRSGFWALIRREVMDAAAVPRYSSPKEPGTG